MKELDEIEARANVDLAREAARIALAKRRAHPDLSDEVVIADAVACVAVERSGKDRHPEVERLCAALRYALAELNRIDVEEFSGACPDFDAEIAAILRGERGA